MDAKQIVKSNQEQAVASWINYLNQIRLDQLLESLNRENGNLKNAMETIQDTLNTISKDIINNGKGRGGQFGMHGFIAEVAECGIGNARSQIEGKAPIYEWINDNGPEDLRRGAMLIQQKFVQSGNHLSLQAIKMHLDKYPDYLDEGGVYQIPADHYEKIKWLLSISKEQADKMPTSTGEFSKRQWQEVQDFFSHGDVPLDSIEPSALDYKSVQRNAYEETIEKEKQSLKQRNQERKDAAYENRKPSLQEGAKATVAAAVIEGGSTFAIEVISRLRKGEKVSEFTEQDWKNIIGKTGQGFIKGGVRGVSIYSLTNFTATPASVASAMTTAAFGIAEQAHKLRTGELDEVQFIENSEILCLDASVSALSSFLGQVIIPVPVLGAVIGNSIGMMMYQLSKDALKEKEEQLIKQYLDDIHALETALDQEYQAFVHDVLTSLKSFFAILEKAFSPDIRIALVGSVELAKECGVPSEEILDSKDKIDSFFLD